MAMPTIYEDGTPSSGTGAISITRGILGAGYLTICVVQTANQSISNVNAGWNYLGSVGIGTAGVAGSTSLHLWWNTDHSDNFTADDPGDHWVGKMYGLLNTDLTQPFHYFQTATVTPAQTAVTFVLPDTTTNNCLIFVWSGGAIDTTSFSGDSFIQNASLDTVGFAGWMQTDNGVGGGMYGGQGEKATAGSCGTMDCGNWASSTVQANVAFAVTDTEQPALGGGGGGEVARTNHVYMSLLGCG